MLKIFLLFAKTAGINNNGAKDNNIKNNGIKNNSAKNIAIIYRYNWY